MTSDDVVNAVAALSPEQLKDVCSRLARIYAQKAEELYDANPEANGEIAQPYADLSDLFTDASFVFEHPSEAPLDSTDEPPQSGPLTVTAAAKKAAGKPWGKF